MTPGAILLDLDDTILNFSGSVEPAWRAICARAAAGAPGLDPESLYHAIDRVRTWYWADPKKHKEGRADLRAASRRIVYEALVSVGFDAPDLAKEMAESYRDLRERAVELFPGAADTLAELKSRGIPLALLTNGNAVDQRAKIQRFNLAPYFECIIIEGEFGAGKPDPRVYRAALDTLRVGPEATWSVGDNLEWDIAAPQRLGLFGVWVDAAGGGLPQDTGVCPDRIVRSIRELL
ncbi:MAG: HAD family hydrolase [Chloroflexi bacterium]|nr:HAD family hydrolase [Chloroflexota bacterium]